MSNAGSSATSKGKVVFIEIALYLIKFYSLYYKMLIDDLKSTSTCCVKLIEVASW